MSVYIPARVRAIEVWRAIQGDPKSIAFTKPMVATKPSPTPATTLAAQTVRISSDVTTAIAEGGAGIAPMRQVKVFGVRDHPSVANTDIAEGYIFALDGHTYRVAHTVLLPGEVQAHAVSTT